MSAAARRHWIDGVVPLAAAEVAWGGIAVAVVPQHAGSIGRLLVGSVVACGALVAVVAVARGEAAGRSATAAPSPLEVAPSPPVPAIGAPGLASARRALTGQATGEGEVPLTPAAWERLAVVAVVGFARRGIDIDNPTTREAARRSVSPAVWSALTTPPSVAGRRPATPEAVAAAVNRVLDEVDGP